MKKFTIFTFCKLFLILMLQAQDFGSYNATWHYSSSSNGLAPSKSEYIKYQAVKDTLFLNQLAKKIEIHHFKINGDTLSQAPLYLFTKNDSVFYFNAHFQRYLLLYDFTAQVNDTLQFYIPDTNLIASDSMFKIVIDSISSVNFNGQILNHYHSRPLGSFSYHGGYIEKIGSKEMLLPQPTVGLPEADGPIRCFEDTSLFINFSTALCDFLVTSLNEITQTDLSFSVYPNPIDNHLTLKFNEGIKINEVALIDLNGKIVQRYSKSIKTINTQELKEGVYFIRVASNYGRHVEKIIIQH